MSIMVLITPSRYFDDDNFTAKKEILTEFINSEVTLIFGHDANILNVKFLFLK